MTIEIPVNKDTITNIAGLIGAIALAVQPIMDGIKGDFDSTDISKLILAVTVAVLGWYSGKLPDGKTIPKGDTIETAPVPPATVK
jgi:hypothetical protein